MAVLEATVEALRSVTVAALCQRRPLHLPHRFTSQAWRPILNHASCTLSITVLLLKIDIDFSTSKE
jgi:hypothetical protein